MTTATKVTLWIIGLAVAGIALYAYFTRDGSTTGDTNATSTDSVVACTMEAKMCPDGSYVGRTGPKCEFTPCPIVSTSTTSTSGVSGNISGAVQYPADWGK